MKQKFSDRQTIYVQTALSVVIALIGWVFTRGANVPLLVSDSPAWREFVWAVFWILLAPNIAGILMYAANLVFYRAQVYRQGPPSEQIDTGEP